MAASIEQVVDLNKIHFDDVVGRQKAYEERIKGEPEPVNNQSKLMFGRTESSSYQKPKGRRKGGFSQRGRGRGRNNNGNRDSGQGHDQTNQSVGSGFKNQNQGGSESSQTGKKDHS